jgi:hypothetical protein
LDPAEDRFPAVFFRAVFRAGEAFVSAPTAVLSAFSSTIVFSVIFTLSDQNSGPPQKLCGCDP